MELSFVNLTGTICWPPLEAGERVSTKQFLDAAKVILKFFDTLGKLYSPVKHDVEGNILKLASKYEKNPRKYSYIQDMIEDEISAGENFAADSLLWLKRGLHFICLFLWGLIRDHEEKRDGDCLLDNMRISYEISLKPYHNWVIQKLFLILSRAAPTRTELFKSMSNYANGDANEEVNHEEIIAKIKIFAEGLESNLQAIFNFYVRLRLDTREFKSYPK